MCAHAVRGSLRKIEGIRDAKVSLKEGMATVQFAAVNGVKVAQVWKAVRDNGFTPRESTIRARGAIVGRGDTLTFVVDGSAEVFVLRDLATSEGRVAALRELPAGHRVEVTGELPQGSATQGKGPVVLHVSTFQRI